MSDLSVPRPTLGRRFALELRPTRPQTWIGPLAAATAGLISSGAWSLAPGAIVNAALVLLLADPILGAWRTLWVQTDWLAPLRIKPVDTPVANQLVPYAERGSPAARLAAWWATRMVFLRSALWPELYTALTALFVVGSLALVVSVVLGPIVIVITLVALALGPIESELGPHGGAWPRALGEIGTALLLGNAALGAPTPTWILLAILLSIAYRGLLAYTAQPRRRFLWSNVGQVGVALVLAWQSHPVSSGLVGISVIAQILWQAQARASAEGTQEYLRRVQWFFLLTMLVAALGF